MKWYFQNPELLGRRRGNGTLLSFSDTRLSRRQHRESELPNLETNGSEDSEIWRKDTQWCAKLTRFPPQRHAPRTILNSIQLKHIHQVACELSQEDAEKITGLNELLKTSQTLREEARIVDKLPRQAKNFECLWGEYVKGS